MHIVLKVPKRQKENPESSKRKVIHYIQGFSTRLRADFKSTTIEARKK